MSELGEFQAAFAAALSKNASGISKWLSGDANELRLCVYRNTVMKGAVDAITANYPTVERMVGTAWLTAAAHEFVEQHPPNTPSLLAYGALFPGWLSQFGPAQQLPYLADIAYIDRLWTEAHLAADARPLSREDLTGLDADVLEFTVAVLHPSLRIAAFTQNIPSLWRANRPPATPPEQFELCDRPERLALVRPKLEVCTRILSAPAHAFLVACANGESLAAAARAGAKAGPDLTAAIAECLEAQVFIALKPMEQN